MIQAPLLDKGVEEFAEKQNSDASVPMIEWSCKYVHKTDVCTHPRVRSQFLKSQHTSHNTTALNYLPFLGETNRHTHTKRGSHTEYKGLKKLLYIIKIRKTMWQLIW